MAAVDVSRVKLGTQGLEVSKLGYGCTGLTGMYNTPPSEDDAIGIIKYTFSKGITFFDTSDVYGADHSNEILLGKVSKLGYGCTGLTGMYNTPPSEDDAIGIIKYTFSKGITFFDTSDVYGADHSNEILLGKVSKLGYGCTGLTGMYNTPPSEDDAIGIIKYTFSKGITFFDTSDVYGADHSNEILLGKALKQLPRSKIELATKFGICSFGATEVVVKGTPEYVRSCCEASLLRLGVDYIDLYYVHRIDTSVPIEETMSELKKLVEEGKIRYIGLSEASPNTIRRAHAVHPISALQVEYSLLTRDIEEEIIPICRELGIGIVPYAPTARGFFGGKAVIESVPATSFLNSHPRFSGQNLEKNKIFYSRIEALAKKHECTPVQLALAWVLHQGDDVVPIPGTTKIKNLDENIGALKVKLSNVDLKEIADAVPPNEVAGPRTGEGLYRVSYLFADTPLPKDS